MSGSSCDFSFLSWSFSDSHAIMSGVVLQSYLCAVVSAVLCCVGLGADKCGTTGKREKHHTITVVNQTQRCLILLLSSALVQTRSQDQSL